MKLFLYNIILQNSNIYTSFIEVEEFQYTTGLTGLNKKIIIYFFCFFNKSDIIDITVFY